jgi:hypothetical protein
MNINKKESPAYAPGNTKNVKNNIVARIPYVKLSPPLILLFPDVFRELYKR